LVELIPETRGTLGDEGVGRIMMVGKLGSERLLLGRDGHPSDVNG